MKIIRQETDYAIRGLLHLAVTNGGQARCAELAGACGIPFSFAHKILTKLANRCATQGNVCLGNDRPMFPIMDAEGLVRAMVCSECFASVKAIHRAVDRIHEAGKNEADF